MVIRLQKYDSFFPARRVAGGFASVAILALTVSRPNFANLDAIHLFHSTLYLNFVSPLIYLKGIRPLCTCKVYRLLCNQRSNYNTMLVQTDTR